MNIFLRVAAAASSALAAGVHASLIRVHFEEGPAAGSLFAAAAAFQLATAVLALSGTSRRTFAMLAAGNLGILAAWAMSRTFGISLLGIEREPVMTHDLITATLEAVAVISLIRLSSRSTNPIRRETPSAAGVGLLTIMGVVLAGAGPVSHHVHQDHAHEAHHENGGARVTAAGVHLHGLRAPGDFDPGPPGRPRATGTTFSAGAQPVAITEGMGAIWVASREDGSVTRIDLLDMKRTVIATGGKPSAIAVGHGLVWVADFNRDRVLTIDPVSKQMIGAPIAVDPGPVALTTDRRSVWVATTQEGSLHRIDPVSRTIEATAPVGFGPSDLAVDSDVIWVALTLDRAVVPVNTRTMNVGRKIPTGAGTASVLASHGRIWTANATDGTVSVIDPMKRRVIGTHKIDDRSLPGQGPITLAAGADHIWVANNHDKTIRPIHATSGAIGPMRTFDDRLGTTPVAMEMLLTRGAIWITNADAGTVSRLLREDGPDA